MSVGPVRPDRPAGPWAWIYKLLFLPYTDLKITQREGGPFAIPDDVRPVLAYVIGKGVTETRLLNLDDSGNVVLAAGSTASPGITRIQDGVGVALATVATTGDGYSTSPALFVQGWPVLQITQSGGGTVLARAATLVNFAAQSGKGAALIAPPGMWAVSSAPAAGTQASAVRAAGAAGVGRVGVALDYGYGATTALAAASQRLVNLRDGASGLGTVLLQLSFPLPALAVVAVNNDALEGRSYPGSAATAMTAEFDALQANLFESVALTGFDVS